MMWSALCWGKGFIVLLDFTTTKKEKPLGWVLCEILSLVSQKPFPLFSSQLSPWVWQLLFTCCFTESLMFVSCSLKMFPQRQNRVFHNLAPISCPVLGSFSLLPSFCFCSHLNMTHWLLQPPSPRQGFDHTEPSLSLEHGMLLASALCRVLFLLPGMLFHHYHLPHLALTLLDPT